MVIACIGWGSLTWNPGSLKCKGGWQNDGPVLPVEFARTSKDGRLTLVLTEGAAPVSCLWVALDYATALDARIALAEREGCAQSAIGVWPGPAPKHGVGAGSIAHWAETKRLVSVVWTALPPKFDDTPGKAPETAESAASYLVSLSAEKKAAAREYIERTPAQIRTPFRAVFEERLGWQAGA